VSWNSSFDNVGVAGYLVYRDGIQFATTSSTLLSDAGLTPSTSHSYAVSAFDAAGNVSAISSPVTGTTQAPPDTIAPSVPQNLFDIIASYLHIDLFWDAATDNVGVTGYRVFRCTGSTCTPASLATTSQTSY